MKKQRLDKLVLERNIATSIEKAQALIMAGQIVVGEHMVDKAGQLVPVDLEIRIKGEVSPYVSRGGLKLRRALDEFAFDVTGAVAVDVGSSTGGFTDCLLQAGAAKVYAVDVGYGQLAWKLQQDSRVISMEKTNIRYVTADQLEDVPDLAVIDASFIPLAKVLPVTASLIKPGGHIIALIKPQFEAEKYEVGDGGIVRDQAVHDRVVTNVCHTAVNMGFSVSGVCDSPITGADGNKEFLILLKINGG